MTLLSSSCPTQKGGDCLPSGMMTEAAQVCSQASNSCSQLSPEEAPHVSIFSEYSHECKKTEHKELPRGLTHRARTVDQSCLTLRSFGLWPARLLCPWDFSGKNTGVSCHSSRGSPQAREGTRVSCVLHIAGVTFIC